MKLTILAVVEVPDNTVLGEPINSDILEMFAGWQVHEGAAPAELLFASVNEGVTGAARAAGADTSSWPNEDDDECTCGRCVACEFDMGLRCPDCGGPMHQCKTGDAGCLHCDDPKCHGTRSPR